MRDGKRHSKFQFSLYYNQVLVQYNVAQKWASLKQTSHDMVSLVVEAQAAMEELRRLLDDDSLEGMRKKLDRLSMVLILWTLEGIRNKLDRLWPTPN